MAESPQTVKFTGVNLPRGIMRTTKTPESFPSEGNHVWLLKVIAGVASCLLAFSAFANRPFDTEDASVPQHGECELEAFHARSNKGEVRENTAEFGCGFGNFMQVKLETTREREAAETARFTGYGLKALLRPMGSDEAGYAVVLNGSRQHGTDGRFFSEHRLLGAASVPLSAEDLVLHLNAGLSDSNLGQAPKQRIVHAAALVWEFTEGTAIGVETFGESGLRRNWRLGIRHQLIKDTLQIDASYGSPYRSGSEAHFMSIGFSWSAMLF